VGYFPHTYTIKTGDKMAFIHARDRLINLDHIIQFFIEQDSRTGKFRIYCKPIDSDCGPFLYEYDTEERANQMLLTLLEEIKGK